MRVLLEYGRTGLDVELPTKNVVGSLVYKECAPLADPAAALTAAVRNPTPANKGVGLLEVAAGRKSACILICDITRPVPNQLILTELLATLEEAGLAPGNILILVATGLHRGNSQAELIEMVGEEIAARYRIENHDGQDAASHSYLGDSPRGVPMWIDRRYLDAELKIATGLIEPHFMAGFSGGRKLICPGIAGWETIRRWHSPAFLEHPLADTGQLDGNPVHEENTYIAQAAGCDMIVNVVIDDQRRPLKFVAGDLELAFLEGVEFVRNVMTATLPEPVDIVVTSSAGYPLDATFYQAIKGMNGALPVVKQGGEIIVAASMSEGTGSPEFRQLMERYDNLETFMQDIQGDTCHTMDQWQLEKLATVRRKAAVTVVTDGLPAGKLQNYFVAAADTVEQAVQRALEVHGHDATIAVIPKGPYVMPKLA